ncbi:hypothetical protein L596_018246 [Steinernema carpocapsae]|uniref:Splicing factor YJU2 n=1 Tax=Steinernema carpocapsae TaxID=34508 RepID=A0A4V6A237_STECR|nr:hypothetical protein L596_018246 [Steinernema carpocapsae]
MSGSERKCFQKLEFVQHVMAPYNMQCNTCKEYIYKGKKFNMRRETAGGENYLGLKIFRFFFRCPNCLAEITFKTDLENCDYQQEHGATRLFEGTLEDLQEVSCRNESVDALGVLGIGKTTNQQLKEQEERDNELIQEIMSKRRARMLEDEEQEEPPGPQSSGLSDLPKKAQPKESAQKKLLPPLSSICNYSDSESD